MRQRRCEAKDPETCRVHGKFVFPADNVPDRNTTFTESEKLKMLLSKEEAEALVDYLDQDYTPINAYLKGGHPNPDPDMIKKVQVLNKALKKYSMLNPGIEKTTFRATKCFQTFANKAEAKAWVHEHFPKNKTVTMAGFTSTTTSPQALFDFLPESHDDIILNNPGIDPTRFGEDEGLGNLVFIIKNKTGVPVSSFGHYHADKEQEYLYPQDAKFVVEQVTPYRMVPNPEEPRPGFRVRKHAHATIITLKEV
jgi:hypothetical protein